MIRILLSLFFFQIAIAQIENFPWPLAPMNVQHRVSATFDECRGDRDHFHNGTDFPLGEDGEVLSIMAGQVLSFDPYGGNAYIRIEDFAYVHVDPDPSLHVGDYVTAGQVIGWTNNQNHIHMNYGGGASGHPTRNPLLPNKITPFEDPYHPRSPIIWFVQDGTHDAFPTNNLSGRVDIVAQAADTTDMESTIDMNNGVYTIGWALYSADTSTVLAGPSFWFEADELYSNSYIDNVYAPGSSTSIYRYIVTNRVFSNGYLNCDVYTPGPYVVSVMSSDTRDNWDTTYVPITIREDDILPPDAPVLQYVGADDAGNLLIMWEPAEAHDLGGYILEFSFNGNTWSSNHGPDVLTAETTSFVVENFPQNSQISFRMKAVDTAPFPNESPLTDSYSLRLNSEAPAYLIVDGFDRTSGSWSAEQHDFATYYARAITDTEYESGITTVTNEWVTSVGTLEGFDAVFWFVGDDSRSDETFSSAEQEVIAEYLDAGGRLFVSGSEIGYDLSAGDDNDVAFMQERLLIDYEGDDSQSYTVNGEGFYFGDVSMGYGSFPYEEDWPDHYSAMNGGQVGLRYSNNTIAGVYSSVTMVLGYTFETINTDEERAALMTAVLELFRSIVSVGGELPEDFMLGMPYPNPFNAQVMLPMVLHEAGLYDFSVYDIRGRQVYQSPYEFYPGGKQTMKWLGMDMHGNPVASGQYIISLRNSAGEQISRAITVLK